MSQTTERTFDWRPDHDPRNKLHPSRSITGTDVTLRDRHWFTAAPTNQGEEGACVGHAWATEAFADPIRVDLARLKEHVPQDPNAFAQYIYGMARHLDPWAGENYSGTSTLAGAQAAQNIGLLNSYKWAFTLQDIRAAVINVGPVILGMNWYSNMYEAPGGVLRVGGNLVGGHAIPIVGYTLSSDRLGGAETFTLQNSWGEDWGIEGKAEIRVDELWGVLLQGGEACVPVSRSYGRS